MIFNYFFQYKINTVFGLIGPQACEFEILLIQKLWISTKKVLSLKICDFFQQQKNCFQSLFHEVLKSKMFDEIIGYFKKPTWS